ncbi:Rhodanese-related sulfurtransferase [Marinobacter persicus]|uniref:Rhodanese-related sulfurtransferase n=1 Tax=Marinobacter persicus TaxID=930118 RepID=A0A1I3SUW9_9GAMM|nr:rhodanese-like domain-containing protein [Marinobacter persicus]GHD40961.1 rhodanese-like domain-containing protein [Marinobacter persicus]SFJ62130.1 Rhodanese-related sulfurtransferase [Marinobacter persicus]
MKTAHDFVEEARKQVEEISVDQADEAIKQADLLLDVRDADEYQVSHIPGATNVSRGRLEFKFSTDPALENRDMNIVVYCKSSGRAALSAKVLQEMGYRHIKSIAGGFDAWQQAGKDTTSPDLPDFE